MAEHGFLYQALVYLAAGGIIALMVVAGMAAHRKNGFFIFRPGEGWEYVMVLGLVAFGVATIGAGEWSLDHALGLDVESWWGAVIAGVLGVGGGLAFLTTFWRPSREIAR